jgi:uncharacterized protein (TIGR03067 family)
MLLVVSGCGKGTGTVSQTDQERIQGEWIVTGGFANGAQTVTASPESFSPQTERFIFSGDEVTWVRWGESPRVKYRFSLNPTATPKAIDLTELEGPKNLTIAGIYRFENDALILALSINGGYEARATQFNGTTGRRPQLEIVLKHPLTDAQKAERETPGSNGVSAADEQRIRAQIDANREAGPTHEPHYLLWEGAVLTNHEGRKVKFVRVKYCVGNTAEVRDRLFPLENLGPIMIDQSKLGDDWKKLLDGQDWSKFSR